MYHKLIDFILEGKEDLVLFGIYPMAILVVSEPKH